MFPTNFHSFLNERIKMCRVLPLNMQSAIFVSTDCLKFQTSQPVALGADTTPRVLGSIVDSRHACEHHFACKKNSAWAELGAIDCLFSRTKFHQVFRRAVHPAAPSNRLQLSWHSPGRDLRHCPVPFVRSPDRSLANHHDELHHAFDLPHHRQSPALTYR